MVHAFPEDELSVGEDCDVGKACAEEESFPMDEDLVVDKELALDEDGDAGIDCVGDESFAVEEVLAIDKGLAVDRDNDADERIDGVDNADFCSDGDC